MGACCTFTLVKLKVLKRRIQFHLRLACDARYDNAGIGGNIEVCAAFPKRHIEYLLAATVDLLFRDGLLLILRIIVACCCWQRIVNFFIPFNYPSKKVSSSLYCVCVYCTRLFAKSNDPLFIFRIT